MAQTGALRNIMALGIGQALIMSCLSLSMTITALVAERFVPHESLVTLPLAIQFAGVMAVTLPASLFMGRFGRRAGFSLGTFLGALAGLILAYSAHNDLFLLFCLGCFLMGTSAGFATFIRFAAAEAVEPEHQPRAISWVMAGGVLAGVIGPEVAKFTRDFIETTFTASYLAISALMVLSLLIMQALKIALPPVMEKEIGGRPLKEVMSQPTLLVAILGAMVAYGAMNLIMVPTPLAMDGHHHSFDAAAFVIQWHVVAMFAPSFFTGNLIERFGVLRIMAIGAGLILLCVVVNFMGTSEGHFLIALSALGVGWNFMYIGGTALLTECYRPEERARVQGINDLLVSTMTVATALSTGALYNLYGWQVVNISVLPPVIFTLGSILVLSRYHKKRALQPAE